MKCPHRFGLLDERCIGAECHAFETQRQAPLLYEWDKCHAFDMQLGEVRKLIVGGKQ